MQVSTWNTNDLQTFLTPVLDALQINIPGQRDSATLSPPDSNATGASTAYLYFGMWKAMFAMHVEVRDRRFQTEHSSPATDCRTWICSASIICTWASRN